MVSRKQGASLRFDWQSFKKLQTIMDKKYDLYLPNQ